MSGVLASPMACAEFDRSRQAAAHGMLRSSICSAGRLPFCRRGARLAWRPNGGARVHEALLLCERSREFSPGTRPMAGAARAISAGPSAAAELTSAASSARHRLELPSRAFQVRRSCRSSTPRSARRCGIAPTWSRPRPARPGAARSRSRIHAGTWWRYDPPQLEQSEADISSAIAIIGAAGVLVRPRLVAADRGHVLDAKGEPGKADRLQLAGTMFEELTVAWGGSRSPSRLARLDQEVHAVRRTPSAKSRATASRGRILKGDAMATDGPVTALVTWRRRADPDLGRGRRARYEQGVEFDVISTAGAGMLRAALRRAQRPVAGRGLGQTRGMGVHDSTTGPVSRSTQAIRPSPGELADGYRRWAADAARWSPVEPQWLWPTGWR